MDRAAVLFAVRRLKDEAVSAYKRADCLSAWWSAKRRAEKAATGGIG